MKINFEDNILEVQKGTKVSDIVDKNRENVIACLVNNEVKSLNYEINEECNIKQIDTSNKDGSRVYTRGLSYIMAKAFKEVCPEALLTVNYTLTNAFFCDVEAVEITEELIKKVDIKMKEIIEKDLEIRRVTMTKEEAEEFYEREKTLNGRLQVDAKPKSEITLYYCEEYFNYFYGVMPLSTGYIKKYEIFKYMDGFLLRYPSRENSNEILPYTETKRLLKALDEYDDISKVLNANTLYKLNKLVKEGKSREIILESETLHEKKMAQICDKIAENKNVRIILIAGPSSSGKTTFANKLGMGLRLNGLKPVTLSVDNYFVNREDTPKDEEGNYDFECIEAVDLGLFNSQLKDLLEGKEVELPEYNFREGKKEYKGKKLKIDADEVLVIEGIHCLNDKLTEIVPNEQKFKIYISALTVLNLDYFNRISTTDTRIIRRIVRDNRTRGYSAIKTLGMWYSIGRGEKRNIFPYQEQADVVFNSSLVYELSVLKKHVLPLLEEIDNTNEEYAEAKRLAEFLKYFEDIEEEYIPNNSLLREFIGGSCFNAE